MNRLTRRQAAKQMVSQNKSYPDHLVKVPQETWPLATPPRLIEVWRSAGFLVQVFQENGVTRISINRAKIGRFKNVNEFEWDDDISWDELQSLKAQCGFGHMCAVEIFPRDEDVVNVANMRHLWVLEEILPFVWRKS